MTTYNNGGPLTEKDKERQQKEEHEFELRRIRILLEQAEHARLWDERMHDFGGEQLSGAQITSIYNWFGKKENQDRLRERLRREGMSDQEINDTFQKVEERGKIWDKMRFGTATPEEKRLYDEIGRDRHVPNMEMRISQEFQSDQRFLFSVESNSEGSSNARRGGNSKPVNYTQENGYSYFPSVEKVGEKFNGAASNSTVPAAPVPKPDLQLAAKVDMAISSI
jgi:hypothetical protein